MVGSQIKNQHLMNTSNNDPNSELTELREELDKGLDELAKLIYRSHIAKVESQTNIVLLSLIAICLLYLNAISPALRGVSSLASLPGKALQSAGNAVSGITSKIPFLPKANTAAGSLKVSGYWAGRAGRGDSFAGGRFRGGSPFGPRVSPGGIGSINHKGQDVPAPSGTPLYAVGMKGEQVRVSCNWSNGGGNQAKLSAPSYSKLGITLGAAHLVEPCKSGVYQAGEIFGRVGSTGNSTGPHLHFAQRENGQFVPPQRWGIEAMMSGRTLEGLK